MKYATLLTIALISIFALGTVSASAQFPFKIPKIKVDKPKPTEPENDSNPSSTQKNPSDPSKVSSKQNSNSTDWEDRVKLDPPRAPSVPLMMIDTLDINLTMYSEYWKFPNQRSHSNWFPKVRFFVFYDNRKPISYTADWTKPDGSLWFSETLESSETSDAYEYADGYLFTSPWHSDASDKLSTDQIGVYGLKITDTATKEVVFQGKYTIRKSPTMPGDAQMKNSFQFYVDNDWHLAMGYAGFEKRQWGYYFMAPCVRFWFKGEQDLNQMEAKLFLNNQEITSTSDNGRVSEEGKSGDGCVLGQEICRYSLVQFQWKWLRMDPYKSSRAANSDYIYTNEKPGEYTVKVFYKGVQVREAKFTVTPDGMIAHTSFTNKLYPSMTMIPVKVLGTAEKWNPAAAQTGMFYGNPIAGFPIQ